MVQKVRQVAQRARKWKEAAGAALDSGEKPTMEEARDLLEAGEKLNLMCDEVKVLRNAVRTARTWANKVKRCKVDEGGANSASVTKLLKEHNSLLLSMPNEFAKLNQALKGYCLCRQPYDGFMIGCDGCGEWYHGPCVGVSEARADKCDKFLCVRCCMKRTFQSSASTVATVIRNWSNPTELRKARQHEAQKHQRKVRKEKRDIENLALETETLAAELNALGTVAVQEPDSEANRHNVKLERVAVSPSSPESETNDDATSRVVDGASESVQSHTAQAKPPETESDSMLPQTSSMQESEEPVSKRKQGTALGVFSLLVFAASTADPFPYPQKLKLNLTKLLNLSRQVATVWQR